MYLHTIQPMSYFFKLINPKWALQPMSYLPFKSCSSPQSRFQSSSMIPASIKCQKNLYLIKIALGSLCAGVPCRQVPASFHGFHETFTSIGVEVSRSNVFALYA